MRKTYILILVLIIIIAGGWFVFGVGERAEAPVLSEDIRDEEGGEITNEMPVPGVLDVEEAVVAEEDEAQGGEDTKAVMSEVKEFTVSGQNYSFAPSLLTVKVGDRVKINFNNTSGFHDLVIDEFAVATEQSNSPNTQTIEFVADKAGTFEYYCSVGSHRALGMVGTLRVE